MERESETSSCRPGGNRCGSRGAHQVGRLPLTVGLLEDGALLHRSSDCCADCCCCADCRQQSLPTVALTAGLLEDGALLHRSASLKRTMTVDW